MYIKGISINFLLVYTRTESIKLHKIDNFSNLAHI